MVGGARAPELGSGVSCRVHVTTSRLQMVGKRHLARRAGVIRGVEPDGIAVLQRIGNPDRAGSRGARRWCSGRWQGTISFPCRSTSLKGEVEPIEGPLGRWFIAL